MEAVSKVKLQRADTISGRAETGPMAFDGDWPGLFIRGDNALAFAGHLRAVVHYAKQAGRASALSVACAERLLNHLESCHVDRCGP